MEKENDVYGFVFWRKKSVIKMFNFVYCWDNIFKILLIVCLFYYIVIDVYISSC